MKNVPMSNEELAFVLQLIVNDVNEKEMSEPKVETRYESCLADRLGAILNQ